VNQNAALTNPIDEKSQQLHRYKTTGNLPEMCPKADFYFLVRLVRRHPHVARLRYQSPGLKPRSIALYQKGSSDPAVLASNRRSGQGRLLSWHSRPLRPLCSGQTMSSSESLTQKWLRQNIAAYNDGNRVFADVDAVLSLHPTLRPKTDIYSSVMCLEQSLDRPLIASICSP
jgi:hypothetical protein